MGYEVGRTFVLDFEGTNLDGVEVSIRSCSIKVLLELEEATMVQRECEILSEHLVSWNLTFNNEPVPATLEGVLSLENALKNAILKEWRKATIGITAPLGQRSSDGKPLEDLSTMMETA